MKIFTVVVFAVMIIAQWFVPLSMVYDTEATRLKGKLFRFETRPVDPTDPFRGKYITLNYVLSDYETNVPGWEDGDEVYVSVDRDEQEIARITDVSKTPPTGTAYYFKAVIEYVDSGGTLISMLFPFERFYLEESKAPATESAYNESNRNNSRKPAYAEVYILDGKVYLDDVKIDGRSVVEIVDGN